MTPRLDLGVGFKLLFSAAGMHASFEMRELQTPLRGCVRLWWVMTKNGGDLG